MQRLLNLLKVPSFLIRKVHPGTIRTELMGRAQSSPGTTSTVRMSTRRCLTLKRSILEPEVNIVVQGTNALVLKDANGTGITIKSNFSHDVADSGISIESNGNVNIGRSDGTTNTVSANGNGGTLQIRGQAIVNTGRLEANGLNGRLILAYESDYFEQAGGSKDYTQLIEMTRPQITGTLDLNMSYSITPSAINEEHMTAWFRFEEGSGEETYSDYGGYTGTFAGNSGNRPGWAAGQFGGAVEFSSNEWINTDAFADTMEVGGNNPRTISIWFKPYLQSHWGSAPNHHNQDSGLYWMGTTDGRFGTQRDGWGLRGFWGGSVGTGNNYTRIRSQHNWWDPEIVLDGGAMDKWMHIVHIYTGTEMKAYVNGIPKYSNAQGMYTSGKAEWNHSYVEIWHVSHMGKCTSYFQGTD